MSQRIRLFMKSECKDRKNRRNITFNFKKIYKNDYFNSTDKKITRKHDVNERSRLFTPPSTRPQTMTPFSVGYNTEIWSNKLKIEEITSETEGVSTNLPENNRVFSANELASKRFKIMRNDSNIK